jgi:glycogen operon protein
VNFALFSKHAEAVVLLLFEAPDAEPSDVIPLRRGPRHIWHALVQGVGAGQLYGFKVDGPYDAARGMRFNPHKLLVDPYAKALTSKARNVDRLLLGYSRSARDTDRVPDRRDNTRVMPKCVVIDGAFDWQGDEPPDIPFDKLVMYEAHIKGFTAHASAGVRNPGTYLGFIEKIPHLQALGVNAVELLPVHESYPEDLLLDKGLTNYWGYNTLAFFAPEISFATGTRVGCQVDEFKTLVRSLHRAGIEVILDVVYNHTAEGNEMGPTLSMKAIDNPVYYCLTGSPSAPGRAYLNYSGCGNSMNLSDPAVIRLVMDSLRYWVQEMHVDGFRFDLASVLGRQRGRFDSSASFFSVVSQDPVLSRVKLIAEPWDIEANNVGKFPVDWAEWNGHFRDALRRFARGDTGQLPELGCRLTGSSDLYGQDGRSPYHSINFITCHDGFTLWDLVSYERKHNEANLEGNRDGTADNFSCNCGVEGETDDPQVKNMRMRLAKNHVCHLLFSLGTPMLLSGDEMLRTQAGNNNAYCQDNALNWIDWSLLETHAGFFAFVCKAIALRQKHSMLRRGRFHVGEDGDGNSIPDIIWYGTDLDRPRWEDPNARTLCYQLDGKEEGPDGSSCLLFLILNAELQLKRVRLPRLPQGERWFRIVDTSLAPGEDFVDEGNEVRLDPDDHYLANRRSTVVLVSKPDAK